MLNEFVFTENESISPGENTSETVTTTTTTPSTTSIACHKPSKNSNELQGITLPWPRLK